MGEERVHPVLPPPNPNVVFTQNREHICLIPFFQSAPQPPVIPIDAICGDPAERHLRVDQTRQHLPREGGLGLE
jgi:hypothetical protein